LGTDDCFGCSCDLAVVDAVATVSVVTVGVGFVASNARTV